MPSVEDTAMPISAPQLLPKRKPASLLTSALEPVRQPPTDRSTGRPSPFDVQRMRRLLDGELHQLKDEVRAILAEPMFRHEYGLDLERQRELVLTWCRELARRGLGQACMSEHDTPRFLAIFETLGYFDLNLVLKFGVQFGLFSLTLRTLGSERHLPWLRSAAAMELVGCFAMTELGHGSNIRALETTASYEEASREFVIHSPRTSAHKQYIGNAACHAQTAIVFAQLTIAGLRRGVHAFLVPLRDANGALCAGVSIRDTGIKSGLNGMDNGSIAFDGVRIPRENLLNRLADVTPDGTYRTQLRSATGEMLRVMVEGRVGIAHAALSVTKTGLAIAVRYAMRRRQFGATDAPEQALLSYPAHQRRLLPRLAATYALDAALADLVERYAERDASSGEFEGRTAVLKAHSTWLCVDTLQVARECCGGQGYLAENRLGIMRSDADAWTTLEGDNTLLSLLAAKEMVSAYGRTLNVRGRAHAMRLLGWELLSRRAYQSPGLAKLRSGKRLLKPGEQLALFRHRERALLCRAARSIHGDSKQSSMWVAFNKHQNLLLELARASSERVLLESFNRRVASCQDAALQQALESLRALYALSTMAEHRGWYLETGSLSASAFGRVDREVQRLCDELSSFAESLVDAFGIPEQCLGAPIAVGGCEWLETT